MELLGFALKFFVICSPCTWIGIQGFFFGHPEMGVITPKNPNALVNKVLELNCTLFEDSGLNSSILVWNINDGTKAPKDTMHIVGERTLFFRKNISSVKEEGTYMCSRRDVEGLLESMVKSVSVVIEYEPVRDVTKFNCVLHEQREEFYCSWELGLYNHLAYLDITIVMSSDNGSTFSPCPQKAKQQQNCTWTAQDIAILSTSKLVILTIKNVEFDVEKSFRKTFLIQSLRRINDQNSQNNLQEMICTYCRHVIKEKLASGTESDCDVYCHRPSS